MRNKKSKNKKFRQNRARWFRGMKKIVKIGYKKPQFVFLGEKPQNGAIILSNHEGAFAPMNLELYSQFPVRLWGTWEMNSGLKNVYKYQTKIYFHNKKHWPLWLAKLACLVVSPLTNLFYKGLKPISTYNDARFWGTLRQSVQSLEAGENVVIFPEHSENGYLPQLTGFSAGFAVLAQMCARKGMDVPIYVAYLQKKQHIYVFDKAIMFSKLQEQYSTREEMANALLARCNQLGKMDIKHDEAQSFASCATEVPLKNKI